MQLRGGVRAQSETVRDVRGARAEDTGKKGEKREETADESISR